MNIEITRLNPDSNLEVRDLLQSLEEEILALPEDIMVGSMIVKIHFIRALLREDPTRNENER